MSSTNLALHFTTKGIPGGQNQQSRHRNTTNKAVLGADDVGQVCTVQGSYHELEELRAWEAEGRRRKRSMALVPGITADPSSSSPVAAAASSLSHSVTTAQLPVPPDTIHK